MPNDKYGVLKAVFGFDSFRPGQEAVVDALLAGENVLAVMPTGSGKSLCFQIPALVRGGLAVVVSPLVALMDDQVAALRLAGVAAEAIHSGRDRPANVDTWRRVAAGETGILYLAPERLMTERMLGALSRLPVSLVAVDEAHCISQWGPAFRPEYEALGQLGVRFPGVPLAALTATADAVTREDIACKLFAGRGRTFVTGFDRPNITLTVAMKRTWKDQLLEFVEARRGEAGIIYCLSRKKTEETAAFLNDHGIRALPYHAGMDKEARAANQDAFVTEPGVVMVATIAFGMGIDKPNVRYVFHTDIPGSLEAYYQEIGRAGRDGLPADAVMLYGLGDIRMRRQFIENEDSDAERKRREHKRLDTLIAYCESPECRRRVLLGYFGEDSEPCGNCDSCTDPADLADGTEAAKQAIAAIAATGQRFGAAHIVDILRGSSTEKAVSAGHDNLPAFGAGAERRKDDWRSILRQMVAADILRLDVQGFGGLSITAKGAALANGDDGVFRYRADTRPAKASRRGTAPASDLPPADAALLDSLKGLRRQLAQQRGVPAYVVFPDKTLEDMARRRPRDETDFAEVHGVGAAKLRDFAQPFLSVIAAADSTHGS